MIKVLFVCLGNICRSPMAEFIFRDMVKRRGLQGEIVCASAATSDEEEGNPVHYGTRRKLKELGISCEGKHAAVLTRADYEKYDYILGMEQRNIAAMKCICGGDPQGKIARLLDGTPHPRDIADPWYTGDFEVSCRDICEGCQALLDRLCP